MVLVLNPRTKKSTIVSIKRDFQVNFPQYPQYSPSKINAAYTYGGVKLLSQTLDRYFKIPVNTYALINMGGMKSIIDQLGGVDITPLLSFDYGDYSYKKGVTTHMNGDKALEYCRMRYDDPEGDYGRQKRQRQVLTAIIKSGADVQSLLKPAFLNSVSSQVRTDLTFSDLTQMAKSYRAGGDQLETDYTHGTGFNQDGVSYQHISLAERQRISDLVRQAAGLKKVQLANGQ
ncbi:LCP family protein [Lactobacillus delbrueckii subsp. bulgaricus]